MIKAMAFACLLALPVAAQAQLTTLYDIPAVNDGAYPLAALLKLNGKFYGTTSNGGPANAGTVFRMDPASGKEEIVYAFTGGADGGSPSGPLIDDDGILYGVTSGGGAGVGTVFKVDPATGSESVLYTFPTAGENGNPQGSLLNSGGFLYGTSEFGGATDNGYVYSINLATNAFAIVHSFKNAINDDDDGAFPTSGLIRRGATFYGTTELGGRGGAGTLYKLDPATGREKPLYSFGTVANDGVEPVAMPTDVNGTLYGTTTAGGSGGGGTVFAFDLSTHVETVLYGFKGRRDGGNPAASLLEMGGTLFGTAEVGGPSGNGTVFAIDSATGKETTLLAFDYQNGSAPSAALITVNDTLYGTTSQGGAPGFGTAFAIDLANLQARTLHDFVGVDESYSSSLTKVAGALYGTTSGAGKYGLGSIYKLNPHTAKGETLYSFSANGEGTLPFAAVLNVNGTLYGTTRNGGAAGQGTVFGFNLGRKSLTTLHSFTGGADGGLLYGGLIDVAGTLYGTADEGGAAGDGTVFAVDPISGAETTIYAFTGGNDGALPYSGVICSSGVLYGTTLSGGPAKAGTVFQIDLASGAESIVYAFRGGSDGSAPFGGLLYENGALYGATAGFGNKSPHGTVFKIDLESGTETVLHVFDAYSGPETALIKSGGQLFGTIQSTDVQGWGSLFRINPGTGAFKTLYNFTGGSDGGLPTASLLNVGGALYGTTIAISPASAGTVFRFNR